MHTMTKRSKILLASLCFLIGIGANMAILVDAVRAHRNRAFIPIYFNRTSFIGLPTAGPGMANISHLKIAFPSQMNENQTLPVTAEYSAECLIFDDRNASVWNDSTPRHSEVRELDEPFKLNLDSSGFEIRPQGSIDANRGAKLPFTGHWTITPKNEGEHYLLLKVEDEPVKPTLFSLHRPVKAQVTTELNGKPIDENRDGCYELKVIVKTYWGVTKMTVSVVGGLMALCGFVLTWPILVAVMKRRLQLQEDEDTATPL